MTHDYPRIRSQAHDALSKIGFQAAPVLAERLEKASSVNDVIVALHEMGPRGQRVFYSRLRRRKVEDIDRKDLFCLESLYASKDPALMKRRAGLCVHQHVTKPAVPVDND